MPEPSLLVRAARIVPMDGPPAAPLGNVRAACLRIVGDRITEVLSGDATPLPGERVLDAGAHVALPGFVQGHVHFCQTLFRGLADDLALLPWLRTRIWPLEAAHDLASTAVAAELSLFELLRGGTTTVQVMESVRHAEASFAAAARAGITCILGNCLMDLDSPDLPRGMATSTAQALRLSEELIAAFHGRGRLHYAISPRFVLSCSEALARDAAALAQQRGLRIHTHAGEHLAEVAEVRARFGQDYLAVLHAQGLLGRRTGLAHCVHTTAKERALLEATGAAVLHCPSTNLKLGSGIAPVAAYARAGVPLALGADGAACNNRLSLLTELRQACLLQALAAAPGAWPAASALWTATRGGALALGIDDAGMLAPGMRADVVLLALEAPEVGAGDVASKVVFAAQDAHIAAVIVGGVVKVEGGSVLGVDAAALRQRADATLAALLTRAGLRR
jgi:5-methylthioadenosine/S-adenosylhomocysteine deaminase